jgi:hypothetical protein
LGHISGRAAGPDTEIVVLNEASIYISLAALLVSGGSLLVSLTALRRDRHVVTVRAVAFIVHGAPWLSVTISNHGKRAISISHIFIRPIGKLGMGRNILLDGSGDVRIDVGQSFSLDIKPGDPVCCWSAEQELDYLIVEVEDALGKRYKARFPKTLRWKRFRRRFHI